MGLLPYGDKLGEIYGDPDPAVAVSAKDAVAMEDYCASKRVCSNVLRTAEEWEAHEQGALLTKIGHPIEVEKLANGPAVELSAPGEGRGPLDGIKIVDLTRVLAGPYGVRILADYGAEVVRVTSKVARDHDFFWKVENVGKHWCECNVKEEADKAKLLELIAGADVVVNIHTSFADLGISAPELCKAREGKPGLVFCNFSAFGVEGPWARRPGFDPNACMVTGMSEVCAYSSCAFATSHCSLSLFPT